MLDTFKRRFITKDKMYDIVVEDTLKALESYNVNTEDFREAYYKGAMTQKELFRFVSMGIPNDSKSTGLRKMLEDIKYSFEIGNKEYSLYNLISLSYMMRHNNLKVNFIKNDNQDVAFFRYNDNSINIFEYGNADTSIHELGHAIHYNLRKNKIPKHYFKKLMTAKINIFKKEEELPSLVSNMKQKNIFYDEILNKRKSKELIPAYNKYEKVILQIESRMRDSSLNVSVFDIADLLEAEGLDSNKASYIRDYLLDKIIKNKKDIDLEILISDLGGVNSKSHSAAPNCRLYSDFLGGLILKQQVQNKYGMEKGFSTHTAKYYLKLKRVFYELFANYNVCCCFGNTLIKEFEEYFSSDLLASVQEIYDWSKFESNREYFDKDDDIQFLQSLFSNITKDELNTYNQILYDYKIDDFLNAMIDSLGSHQCAKILTDYYFNGNLDERLSPVMKEDLVLTNKMQIRKIILEKLPPYLYIHEKFHLEMQEAKKNSAFYPEYVEKELFSFSDSENIINDIKAYDCYEDITHRKYKIVRDENDEYLKITDLSQILNQAFQKGIDINFIRNIIVFDDDFLNNKIENDTLYIYKNSKIEDIINMIEKYAKENVFLISNK